MGERGIKKVGLPVPSLMPNTVLAYLQVCLYLAHSSVMYGQAEEAIFLKRYNKVKA